MNGEKEQLIQAALSTWVGEKGPSQLFPNEDWNSLQLLVSLDQVNDESVRYLLSYSTSAVMTSSAAAAAAIPSKVEINYRSRNLAVPSCTALHIAVAGERMSVVKQLIDSKADVNVSDQFGFTPLHYAVAKRNKELVLLLIEKGASVTVESLKGTNPLDLAKELNDDEIESILMSKMTTETDETLPQFKAWLVALGAGEYFSKFVEQGHHLPFVVSNGGFDEADLDLVGITKRGLRKRILKLDRLGEFYEMEEGDEEDEEGEEGEEEEEEEEEA